MTGANEREIVHPDLAAWLHTSGLRLENRGQALPDRLIVPPAARLHACFWDDVKRHPEDFGENMHVEHCYSLRPHAAVTDALLFSPRVRNAMSASPYCAALMRAPVVEHASNLSWEAYGRAGTVVLLYIQIVYAPSTPPSGMKLRPPSLPASQVRGEHDDVHRAHRRAVPERRPRRVGAARLQVALVQTPRRYTTRRSRKSRAEVARTTPRNARALSPTPPSPPFSPSGMTWSRNTGDEEDWSSKDWMLALAALVACFSSFLQICFELAEVTSAPAEYFTDFTNINDWVSCCFVFYVVYTGVSSGPLHEWRAIGAALLQLVWLKFLPFMRPFEFTASFVPLINTILVDMVPFIVCCLVVNMMISLDFFILGMGDGKKQGTLGNALEESFRFMIGESDYFPPVDTSLDRVAKFVYFEFALGGTVILLNALIAIMGASFDKAKEAQRDTFLLSRASALHQLERVHMHTWLILPCKRRLARLGLAAKISFPHVDDTHKGRAGSASLFSQVEHYAAVSMQAAWRMKRVFAMMQKLVKVRRQMEALALQAKADEEGDDLATLQQEVARTRRGLQREVSRRMDNAGEERELLSSPSRFELDREQVREAEAPSRARARRRPSPSSF